MQICYVLIKMNDQNLVERVYCPDTNLNLDLHDLDLDQLRSVLEQNLKKHLTNNSVLFTKQYQDLYLYPIQSCMHWECCMLDLDIPIKSCAYLLPTLGYIFNSYNLLSGAFVTFMALQINGAKDDNERIFLSVAGSLLNFTFNIIIYVYSDAATVLSKLGWYIDNKFKECSNINRDSAVRNVDHNDIKSNKYLLYLILIMLILINVTISAIKIGREHSLLKIKFLDSIKDLNEEQKNLYDQLIDWMVIYLGIGAGVYCALAFQASFALKMNSILQNNTQEQDTYQPLLFQYQNNTRVTIEDNNPSITAQPRLINM